MLTVQVQRIFSDTNAGNETLGSLALLKLLKLVTRIEQLFLTAQVVFLGIFSSVEELYF